MPEEKWPDFKAEEQSNNEKEAEVLKEMKTSEKASVSAKPEVPKGDVNAVNPETATTEAIAKLEQVKSEDNPVLQKLLENCSTFPKIRGTLAYVLRFVQNTGKKNVKTGPITVQELKESENQLFKWSQFYLKPSVVVKKLIPSLDENGIIRAHGRLEDVRLLQQIRKPCYSTTRPFTCYVIYTKSVDIVATKA